MTLKNRMLRAKVALPGSLVLRDDMSVHAVCALLQAGTATPVAVNTCMVMLQQTARDVASLAEQGDDVTQHSEVLTAARSTLERAVSRRAANVAAACALPAQPADVAATCRLPACVLPAPVRLSELPVSTMKDRRTRAARNIGSLPLLPARSKEVVTLADTLQLVSTLASKPGHAASLHALRGIERTVFGYARQLSAAANPAPVPVPVDSLGELAELVDRYNEVMERFMTGDGGHALMQTEQRSLQVLVAWAAYCLMHAAVCSKHPMLAEYGVSLQWGELQHIVLGSRAPTDTLLAVAAYLRRHTRPEQEVFAAHKGRTEPTFTFAQRFAEHSQSEEAGELRALWEQEQQRAAAREQGWWRAVQAKQRRVRKLRSELRDLEGKAAAPDNSTDSNSSSDGEHGDPHIGAPRQRVQEEMEAKKKEISKALKPPPLVIQPLPQDRGMALQWLFFLHMPAEFRHLSRMSYLAQQLMLPRPLPPDSKTTHSCCLTEHYNRHQTSNYAPDLVPCRSELRSGNLLLVTKSDQGLYRVSLIIKISWDSMRTAPVSATRMKHTPQ